MRWFDPLMARIQDVDRHYRKPGRVGAGRNAHVDVMSPHGPWARRLTLLLALAAIDGGLLAASGDPCGLLPRPTTQTGDGGASYVLG
jgi:hypothetical protein